MLTRATRRFGTSLALALAVLGAPFAVQAEEGRWLELTWRAPPDCPPASEIEKEITRLVGSSRREGATVRAVVDVTGSDEQGWRANVRTEYRGETGDRTLEGATCRAVARAAALVIALPVDSKAHPPEPPPPPPPPPEPIVKPPVVVPTPLPAERPLRWFVAIGPRSEVGLLQSPGFGLGIGLGARIPLASIELFGAGYLPQSTTVDGSAAGGRFTLVSAGVRLCPRLVRGMVEVFACASASLDRLSAQGFGVTTPGSASTTLATVLVGPGVDFSLTRAHRLRLGVDATYTPGNARFVLANVGPVHTAAKYGGVARLELGWYF